MESRSSTDNGALLGIRSLVKERQIEYPHLFVQVGQTKRTKFRNGQRARLLVQVKPCSQENAHKNLRWHCTLWTISFAGEDRYHEVNKVRVHYLFWNAKDFGFTTPAPSLLLIHGTTAHAHWYDHIAPFFADIGFDVIALDLAGFGDSQTREGGYCN